MTPTIAITNESSVLTDQQLMKICAAMQIQVSRDYAPIWGTDARLLFFPKGNRPTSGTWVLHVLDDSDQAGALGYHEVTSNLPVAYAFAKSDVQAGLQPSVTISHELLEMLVDPWIFATVAIDNGRQLTGVRGTSGVMVALETCDACEADNLGYQINGVLVSDFVTPAWFGAPGNKYDFLGHCQAPLQLLPGGYIGARRYRPLGDWTQVTQNLSEEVDEPEAYSWHVHMGDGSRMPLTAIPPLSRRGRRLGLPQQPVKQAA